MMWRSIIIITTHFTIALLGYAGFSWLTVGEGINPLIAFPAAIILYVAHLLWIEDMSRQYECNAMDLLERIDQERYPTIDLPLSKAADYKESETA